LKNLHDPVIRFFPAGGPAPAPAPADCRAPRPPWS